VAAQKEGFLSDVDRALEQSKASTAEKVQVKRDITAFLADPEVKAATQIVVAAKKVLHKARSPKNI